MEEEALMEHMAKVADATEAPSSEELRVMARGAAARGRGRPSHPRRPAFRGHRLAVLFAALAVVAGSTAATAALLIQDQPNEEVETAVSALFPEGKCVTGAQAMDAVQGQLGALEFGDWTVALGQGASLEGCVAPGFATSERTIVLVPVDHPDVVAALESVRGELMSRCFNEQEARALLSTTLAGVGASDGEIRTDGPLAYPEGERDAVLKHVAAGCFVFSGSGRSPDGPVYYISGGET